MSGADAPAKRMIPPPHDFLVFAYGSLMWNPGFPHLEVRPARLIGYHRTFCLYSEHYRGTSERPGLVLGLDRGGSCLGRAYKIAAAAGPEVARYLDERELLGGAYDPRWVQIRFEDGRRASAYAYVIDRACPHYAGRLELDAIAEIIAHAAGARGSNLDYLVNTVRHLDELGIAESALHEVLERVQRRLAQPAPESGG
ncbi:MAG TPA: gamma-glutamylcyclotransferase [Alphaproteobacteria bacterium]|nr:gamma-glutamylcyclotransferase [Alphaproteobacteria bacterium]